MADSGLQRVLSELFVVLREAVKFLQPFVQPQPWQRAELTADWSLLAAYPQGEVPGFRKDPLGRVHLRGRCVYTGASGLPIFWLPSGHRPPRELTFVVESNAGAASVSVASSGSVDYFGGGTPATYLSLDGISFDTEA